MMELYTAWIAVLFRRLGEGECRISMNEIREGLGQNDFSAVRVEDEYVITLKKKAETEVNHVGDEA